VIPARHVVAGATHEALVGSGAHQELVARQRALGERVVEIARAFADRRQQGLQVAVEEADLQAGLCPRRRLLADLARDPSAQRSYAASSIVRRDGIPLIRS